MCSVKVLVLICSLTAGVQALDIISLQLYGLYTLILQSHLLECTFNKTLGLDVSLIKIYMYDFANNINSTFYLNETKTFLKSYDNFDANRTTLVYVPGFNDEVNDSSTNDAVRTNLANVSNSYLYMIDHHDYTYRESILKILSSYERSVKYCWDIGKAVTEFLIDLIDYGGIDYNNTVIMGHSLGGQIIAAVGEVFMNTTNNTLPLIKAFDPAGPCYTKAPKEFQMRSGLARFTETYHCNADQLGTIEDYADANYYVNGGYDQPGCNTPIIPEVILSVKASFCSHGACPNLVTMNARKTEIWEAFPCSAVKTCKVMTKSANETVRAGFYSNKTNSGLYYFKANS